MNQQQIKTKVKHKILKSTQNTQKSTKLTQDHYKINTKSEQST